MKPRIAGKAIQHEDQHAARRRPGDVILQRAAILANEIVGRLHHDQAPAAEERQRGQFRQHVFQPGGVAVEARKREIRLFALQHRLPQDLQALPLQERLAAEERIRPAASETLQAGKDIPSRGRL